ncbi:39S ribosomal protein L13, mitochondrial [Halotydeus destructor]|nr:39S ribosomal protein L13, mitochondrial [Halotydeus destructor]
MPNPKPFNVWSYPYQLTKQRRAAQWQVFARSWYLIDCKWQDPFDLANTISMYLQGKHKPIYDNIQDLGDHVVAINTKELAMPEGEWRWRMYYHHSRYAKGTTWAPAFDLHMKDPTMVLYKACYKNCGEVQNTLQKSRIRRQAMTRLHLYPDEVVPKHIMENIVDQIQNHRPVHKALHEISDEEKFKFPKVVDYPDDFVIKKDD